MFNIKAIEAEARKELAETQAAQAKARIKDKLGQIAKARAVVANLEHEYEVLLREIGADVA